jgi:hypothetical protein
LRIHPTPPTLLPLFSERPQFASPSGLALAVFLRGINVGGHKTFRPSILANELSDYGVVNVGAAGTFVVRKPVPREKFRAALLEKLPFEAQVVLCDGRDLLRLEARPPEKDHKLVWGIICANSPGRRGALTEHCG